MPPRAGNSIRTVARTGYVILLSPATLIRSRRDRQLATPCPADPLQAGRCAQLQRGVQRTRRVRRPVADLPRAEIQEPAPIIRGVIGAVRPHGGGAEPRRPI